MNKKEKVDSKKEILKLDDEILKLECDIKTTEKFKFKYKLVRNLKVVPFLPKILLPSMISVVLSVGIVKVSSNSFPFVKDEIKKYKQYYISNTGDETIVSKDYVEPNILTGKVSEKKSEVTYSTTTVYNDNLTLNKKVYNFNFVNEDLCRAFIESDISYISDNYKYSEYNEPILSDTKVYPFTGNLYYVDYNDFVREEESNQRNYYTTLLFILCTMLSLGINVKLKESYIRYLLKEMGVEYDIENSSLKELKEELKLKRKKLVELSRKK